MKIEYKIHLFQNWISLIMLAIIFLTSSFTQGFRNANTDQIKLKWLDIAYAATSQAQKLEALKSLYISDLNNKN